MMSTLHTAADRAFAPVQQAIDAGRIPGAALGLVSAAGERAVRLAGLAQRVPLVRPLRREHYFDLASLTKVLVTLPMVLKARGRIALETQVADVLPELCQVWPQAPVRALTLEALLSHQSGLPAWDCLYLRTPNPAALKALIGQTDWPIGPPVYSDIGLILVGLMLERLHGRPFPDLAWPAGFTAHPPPYRAVATEDCRWRRRVMCGEVHDENAFALGGAAGHAGAFATVDAVLDAALGHLDGSLLDADDRALLLARRAEDRGLGWLLPHAGWPGGAAASPDSIGHTGFTGTSLIVDFGRGLAWTLLTNRVHPDRHADSGILQLRRDVSEAVLAA